MNYREIAEKLLKDEEGYSEFPYEDTKGYLTIGWGHNLDARGISKPVAQMMFDEQMNEVLQDLHKIFDNLESIDDVRKAVLVDMRFNMGPGNDKHGFRSFKGFIRAIKAKDFNLAAEEMEWKDVNDHNKGQTGWWNDVKTRAPKLQRILRSGSLT